MFASKLITIAAAVALTVSSVSAIQESTRLRLRIHNKDHHAVCSGPKESPMSVEGVEGVFCVSGQACVADIAHGACPGPQKGLEWGSYCGKVKTGVYGCKPNESAPKEDYEGDDYDDEYEGKEEEEEEKKPEDYDDEYEGEEEEEETKPEDYDDDYEGEYEDEEKPEDDDDDYKEEEKTDDGEYEEEEWKDDGVVCDGEGESPMSVEGVGTFCVTGQACVADIKDGACPGPQEGLEYGASCGIVKTGVYGCKPNPAPEEDYDDYSEEEKPAEDDYTEEEKPAEDDYTEEKPVEDDNTEEEKPAEDDYTEEEKPAEDDNTEEEKPATDDDTYESGEVEDEDVVVIDVDVVEDPVDVVCGGEGESPMSVEGVEGIFCVTGQACVADIADGACPGPQEGLEFGASCGIVQTGVYGCKPNEAKRHHKKAVKKVHATKVHRHKKTKKHHKH